MFSLQAPPRNLFSSRLPRAPQARNVGDYLASLRGAAPTWGVEGNNSPQWHAATEVVEMRLAAQLADRLRAMTGLRSCRTGAAPARVVEQYFADVAALGDQFDAVNYLFAQIALHQTSVSVDLPPSADVQLVLNKARELFAQDFFPPQDAAAVLGRNIVSADFLSAGAGEVLAACQQDVDRRVEALAAYVVGTLCGGLASGLLGLAVWPSTHTCWYVRNEHRLQLKKDVWRRVSLDRSTVRHVYDRWMVVKEVHLMDAAQLRGVPGWLELPPAVEGVVRAVPPLLHPDLSTVVGTMVKEREISWYVGQESYTSEHDHPQRQPVIDPAITIGSVVLTGWESPEHRRPGWWMRLDRYLAG